MPAERDARAGLRERFRHGRPQAAGEVVLLDGENGTRLGRGGENLAAIERIDRVHVDHASLDAVRRQAVGGVQAGTYL